MQTSDSAAAIVLPADETVTPLPCLLHQIFEATADARPDHAALEHQGTTLTYAELDARANRMAHFLTARGIGRGALVPLFMKKCPELFVALLGVLKAGAAYVPIDAKFPLDRVAAIIDDARAPLVLTHEAMFATLDAAIPGLALSIDASATAAEIAAQSTCRHGPATTGVTPADACYVIFTSGSTGRPKGVMVEHRNASAFVACLATIYGVGSSDRVYQGFSIAFDAAVEEVWAAFAHGGTLVVGSEDVVRSPLDAAQFLSTACITFLSTVPSFLAMIDEDLPTVRRLVVGGESCPPELVTRWARDGRRMFNSYGPTESTVVATAVELRSGAAITIGRPLPGYYAYILDDMLRPVKPGEAGELYIGGAGVARGYVNRDALTAERFIADPFRPAANGARLYRSYDQVRLTTDGNIAFLGRLDGQIKLRGFRIELPEIEAVLMTHASVRAAAVSVTEAGGQKELAAFVVLANAADPLDRPGIAASLASRLPEYMVPKYLDVLPELPLTTSAKIDRKALPAPKTLLKSSLREAIPPRTPMEKLLADIWREAIGVNEISIDDDFFLDLGGHSLVAAHVVTAARKQLAADAMSVRDIYQHRTIRKLAEHTTRSGSTATAKAQGKPFGRAPTAEDIYNAQSPWTRAATMTLQALAIYVYYAIVAAPFVAAIVLTRMTLAKEIALADAVHYGTVASFLAWPSMLVFTIALKWLVIGRYKPGRYPLWGFYYFRWWLVNRFQALAWPEMFAGSPLMSLYMRAMGARVGRNAVIGTAICSAFDMIAIGADTAIGVETQLLGYRVEDGMLVIGHIDIGDGCFVGMHCAFGLNVTMGDGAKLDDLSALADGETMRAGEERRGCPSVLAPVDVPQLPDGREPRRRPLLFGFLHLVLIYVMGYFLILTMAPSVLLTGWALQTGGYLWGMGAAFLSVPVGFVWYVLALIAVKWLFIGRVKPGVHAVSSLGYLRHWFLDYLLNNTREILLPLYATTYFPTFLRLLGARVGRNVEISTVLHVTPDLLNIGTGSFCADAALIGGKRIYRGVVNVQANSIGARTFIGNSAVVPGGAHIGDDCLVGVMSTPPAVASERIDGQSWFGSPGFVLPRQKPTVTFSAEATFRPSRRLQAARAAIDLVRIFLPGMLMAALMIAFVAAVIEALEFLPLAAALALAPAASIALGFAGMGLAAGVKHLLIGRFVPGLKPLYSLFVWLNEIVNAVFEVVAASAMAPLLGTRFIATPLRWMGCRIGHATFIDTTLFSEFDLVEIGDFAALNLGTTVQTHLFEDRVMKTAGLRIGRNCSVANMTAILYGTEMKDGSWLGPLSVLMKGEMLPANTRWHGIPTQLALPTRPASRPVPPAAWTAGERITLPAAWHHTPAAM